MRVYNTFTVISLLVSYDSAADSLTRNRFNAVFSWHYLNFTWPSEYDYQAALRSQHYVPINNHLAGVKVYNNIIYISLPRFYPGTPVTLASFRFANPQVDPLLEPYPSWDMNVGKSCHTLQNVYSMEIDTKGIMWVLDGFRFNNLTNCPPKIVLLDTNKGGKVIQTYDVPDETCPHQGGWMNDLVIDESDGGYAYISEVSNQDPGVIVYSRTQNKAWKLRDRTMFAELDGEGFLVRGAEINGLHSVDGVALAPVPKSTAEDRLFYYTPLTGYSIHALSTKILKNESIHMTADWRKNVQYIGNRPGATDGMVIDNAGFLYFGLLDKYAIAKWNIYKPPFDKNVQIIYQNYTTVDWPDTFGMNTYGNLYVTDSGMERVHNSSYQTPIPNGIRYRILQCHTGTRSYLYS